METRLLRFPGRPLPRFSIPAAEGAGLGNGPLPARRPLAAVHRPSCSEGVGGPDRRPAPLNGRGRSRCGGS